MNSLLELLNSDLPLALAVILAGVILLQIVPALRVLPAFPRTDAAQRQSAPGSDRCDSGSDGNDGRV